MTRLFFTPGPSQLHPRVPSFLEDALRLNIGSISHRSAAFQSIFDAAASGVRPPFGAPEDYQIFFLSSATEAMERIIQNCVNKSSFHFVHGSFSERFFSIAQELGKDAHKRQAAFGEGFWLEREAVPNQAELICITQNETSTGVCILPEQIEKLARHYPQPIIAVDIVSSAPCVKLPFPAVDCAFFSVQKLFGLPAGLGVLLISPRAIGKSHQLRAQSVATGSYHSFQCLAEFALKSQTPETPNVLGIYLLGRICQEFLQIGLETVNESLLRRSKQLYSWLKDSRCLRASVSEEAFRSPYVITVAADKRTGEIIKCLDSQGIEVGEGYGPLKGSQFRVANFPACTDAQWDILISGLKGLE